MERTGIHELSAAYALDALDGDERREFEEHLTHCADCRQEVASLPHGDHDRTLDMVITEQGIRRFS